MNNRFHIPEQELTSIRLRDKVCAYCGKSMVYPYERTKAGNSATIEHLSPDPPYYWEHGMKADNIVICCGACNSSRGAKQLSDWFAARYCLEKGICVDTVADPVRKYLLRLELQK